MVTSSKLEMSMFYPFSSMRSRVSSVFAVLYILKTMRTMIRTAKMASVAMPISTSSGACGARSASVTRRLHFGGGVQINALYGSEADEHL